MTLNYAARASHIENAPVIHVDSKDALLMSLKRDLRHLRVENKALRAKLSLPAEGPVLDLLSSMPVLVPVDSVLVAQSQAVPSSECSAQTEPLHPSHLYPRPPQRVPKEGVDAAGKGTLQGRHRGRLMSGQASGAPSSGASAAAAATGTVVLRASSDSAAASAAAPLRLNERLADRAGRQLVLDMQQSELAVLAEERDAIKQRLAAAQARMAVLV